MNGFSSSCGGYEYSGVVGTNFVFTNTPDSHIIVEKGSYSGNVLFPMIGVPVFGDSPNPRDNSYFPIRDVNNNNVFSSSEEHVPISSPSMYNSYFNSEEIMWVCQEGEGYACRNHTFLDRILAPPTAFADDGTLVDFCESTPEVPEYLVEAPQYPEYLNTIEEPSKNSLSSPLLEDWPFSQFTDCHCREELACYPPDANMGWGQPNVGKRCRNDNAPEHSSGYSASESETDEEIRAHLMNKRSRDVSPVRTAQAVTDFTTKTVSNTEDEIHMKRPYEIVSESLIPSTSYTGNSCRSDSIISTTTHMMTAQEYPRTLDQRGPIIPGAYGGVEDEEDDDDDDLPSECFLDSRGNVHFPPKLPSSDHNQPAVYSYVQDRSSEGAAARDYRTHTRDKVAMPVSGMDRESSPTSSESSTSVPVNGTRDSPPRSVPRFKGPRVPASRGRGARSPPKSLHIKKTGSDFPSDVLKAKLAKQNGIRTEQNGNEEVDEEEDDDSEFERDSMEDEVVGLKGDEALEDDASTSTDITLPNIVRKIVPPIRPSYFPNVPPYINFCLHDEKSETLPMEIRKHLKWRMSTITPVIIRKTVNNSGFRLLKKTVEWGGQWGKHMKGTMFRSTLKDFQKLNHLPATFQLGRKDRLWRNIYRFILKYGKTQYGFLPRTYILPHDMKQLKHAWDGGESKGNMWIVKPPAGARGTGIRVVNKWNQVPKKRPVIVQQYISKPLLINDRKFDLRLYVLVTNFHPLRVYLYNDGLVRFAPVKYSQDVKRVSDRFMHLTNYSINKECNLYTQNEDANACKGHKWTLKTLWRYLETQGTETAPIIKRIEDIVIKTLISAEENITASSFNMPSRYTGYELFGFDIILDESFKPWLLEVNISPSLHSSSPLDVAVKGQLVKEVFNIAGYHLPPSLSKNAKKMFVERLDKDLELEKPTFDKRIYCNITSKEEKLKQQCFRPKFDDRSQYLTEILETLTPDDIRHLLVAEDELSQCNGFSRIFPTQTTHSYFAFFEGPRYYNMLMDAWESKYDVDRAPGIRRLQELCRRKIHLATAPTGPQPTLENHGDTLFEEKKNVAQKEKCFLATTTSGSASATTVSSSETTLPKNTAPINNPNAASIPEYAYSKNRAQLPAAAAATCAADELESSSTTATTLSHNSDLTQNGMMMNGSTAAAVKMERFLFLQDGGPRSNNNAGGNSSRAAPAAPPSHSPSGNGEHYSTHHNSTATPVNYHHHHSLPDDHGRLSSNILNNNVSNNNVSNASNTPVNEYNKIKGVCY